MDAYISSDHQLAGSLASPPLDHGNHAPTFLQKKEKDIICAELAGIAKHCEAPPFHKRGREIEIVRAEHEFLHSSLSTIPSRTSHMSIPQTRSPRTRTKPSAMICPGLPSRAPLIGELRVVISIMRPRLLSRERYPRAEVRPTSPFLYSVKEMTNAYLGLQSLREY